MHRNTERVRETQKERQGHKDGETQKGRSTKPQRDKDQKETVSDKEIKLFSLPRPPAAPE